jgi:hypothetical protein
MADLRLLTKTERDGLRRPKLSIFADAPTTLTRSTLDALLDAGDMLDEVMAALRRTLATCDLCAATATLWGPLEARCDEHRSGAAVVDAPLAPLFRRWEATR